MKKILSLILVFCLLTTSSITAFAMTENEVIKAYNALEQRVNYCRDTYVLIFFIQSSPTIPIWSDASMDLMKAVTDQISDEMYKYKTAEDFEAANKLLDETIEKMYIGKWELDYLLKYIKRDVNSTGYYDEATMQQLKEAYSTAQTAFESGTEEEIHYSYVAMRNQLNKLCIYNRVWGDVTGNGVFDIADVTLMQKVLCGLYEFNSSQAFVSRFNKYARIDTVTWWQKRLVGMTDFSSSLDFDVIEAYGDIDVSLKDYNTIFTFEGKEYRVEELNYLYYFDAYSYWFYAE